MTDEPIDPFPAFRLREDGSGGELTEIRLDQLGGGEVVIRAAYSSVNYKDALAGTGQGRIARKLPLVGGIDVAGTVHSARGTDLQPGERVLVTGCGLSEDHDGGFAAYVRVPVEWVIRIPEGLGTYEAMALGTAGFTAALALIRLEENGLDPDTGPVAVTGATGGVGSLAVDMLAARGYEAIAVTGKTDATDYLCGLGASEVLGRAALSTRGRPLERGRWAGAVDNLGDGLLAELLRTTLPWGAVASIGLAGGHVLETTVMPLILRGVTLVGITSANCPRWRRERVWQRLSTDLKPPHLEAIVAETIELEELPGVFRRMLAGEARGRTVVSIHP